MIDKTKLETALQRKIMRSAESEFRGEIICFKIKSASIDGVPDVFMGIERYGGVFVEVKKDEEQDPRVNQKFVIRKLNKAGVKAVAIKSWPAWVSFLEEIKKVRNVIK